jgi:hypothetical protein
MQGVGRADDLSYFKCPTAKQMRRPLNASEAAIWATSGKSLPRYMSRVWLMATDVKGDKCGHLFSLFYQKGDNENASPEEKAALII